MTENPYASGTAISLTTPKTRANYWLVWSGAVVLVLAVICVLATIFGMIMSFDSVATSGGTTKPSDLAEGISLALIPSYAAVPLGVLGVVLLVVGLVVRRPVASP